MIKDTWLEFDGQSSINGGTYAPKVVETITLTILLFILGCGANPAETTRKTTPPAASVVSTSPPLSPKSAVCAILAINDTYHIEPLSGDRGGFARVRALRASLEKTYPDLLVTHAGDIVSPSFLGRMYNGAHMIEALNLLDGSDEFDHRLFATFGNHEFDLKAGADLSARIAESKFRFISSNVHFHKNGKGEPDVVTPADKVMPHKVVSCGGMSVGLFGLTIDKSKPGYVEAIDEPIESARKESAALREEGAEVIVAITHLAMTTDKLLLETLGDAGPDLILGGHEHERQQQIVGKRGVYKADADGVSANIARIQKTAAGIEVAVETRVLEGASAPEDPALQHWVHSKLAEHERRFCSEQITPPGGPKCLSDVIAMAGTELVAEELRIRKYETNLGDWVADLALGAFPRAHVPPQIAFINSGSLRLNANIPNGTPITRRVIEELFAFPEKLVLIRIDGVTLQKVVDRSVSNWTGEGHFLQISGFSFIHDTKNGKALELRYGGPNGRLVQPNDVIHAVTLMYLADDSRDQDGYTMLQRKQIVESGRSIKDVVLDGFMRMSKENKVVAPRVEGRICVAPCVEVNHDISR